MSEIDLEARLKRLETSIEAKLNLDQLQKELDILAKNPTIREILHWIDTQPGLYESGPDSGIPVSQRIDNILGQEEIYRSTAAQLQSISQISIPTVATSQHLVDILPEVRIVYDETLALEAEIEELTTRTIAVLDQWYRLHVRPVNQMAVNIDRALTQAQKQVKAIERSREE
ncbi:protein of unknown function [Taphrina deformans PYCC 5710]|uniref:Uncharacterized protein n=1 Tax=Taphrina deformans (strain PYCC 5710 / ATCC 11124 / CBS 356.35 / IMI 108563 / JCM 9778 / NBRC 8474) TaxID=1097556 RepID=R4XCT0_TAPDE|nr:protein of unknown function [Taphrina deformans PYCC 5710]|eukprot:CCG83665.1 protein of unknown function [Taphrina deformans PYCC 5710]